jgi:TM2 domain-containing membrane protein YozV
VKKSTKAVLLSAFIFPGVGHIYLKKFMPGVVLVGSSFAAISYLISRIVERAFQISDRIQRGDVQLDIETITEFVSKQSTGADTQLLNIATIALIICWLIGIIDSYRIGCVRDKNDDVPVSR